MVKYNIEKNKGKKTMTNWYQVRERGAGRFRIEFLWWVYKIFGTRVLKVMIYPIVACIVLFGYKVRTVSREYRRVLNSYASKNNLDVSRFSSVGHVWFFACSVVDKIAAICDKKNRLKFEVNKNTDWNALQKLISNKRGAFFLCSHLGNIEALCAIPNAEDVRMHAFMNVGQNAVFRNFIDKHSNYTNTIIHPTEDMGCDCALPVGVFRFARACDCPVFTIANINVGGEKYKVFVKQINTTSVETMASGYIEFLAQLITLYPKQWFNFFDFFGK